MFGRLLPNSLTLRAIFFSTIWAAISLVAIASVITALYRSAAAKLLGVDRRTLHRKGF